MARSTQVLEKMVVRSLVSELLGHGLTISVFDGEEWPVKRGTKRNQILDALFACDAETILIRDGEDNKIGRAYLVYGNDGYDVIADYSVALEPYMTKTWALVQRLDA